MKEINNIWMNGKLIPFKNAKVHVLTYSLHYSTAIFEGMRCYDTVNGPAIFRLPEHINRFFKSAKMYSMKIPYSKELISKAIIDTVKTNSLKECYIRPIAYYGYGEMGLTPRNDVDVAIACWKWNKGEINKKTSGVKCKVSSWLKIDSRSQPMKAKAAANYSNAALARMEALNHGYDEAILLNYQGKVAECSAEHIFIFKDNSISTPPLTAGIFNGITRDSIIKILNYNKEIVIETDLDREELYTADEVFIVGTAAEIKAVVDVDHIKIGNGIAGKITKKVQKQFKNITTGKDKKFMSWLKYI